MSGTTTGGLLLLLLLLVNAASAKPNSAGRLIYFYTIFDQRRVDIIDNVE